ncbi:MAG: DUF2752 domain-containing protein [Paludibacteraceae bacterium]|nr:DUF2752 domain-containing protein [Paludibacteraceae bacterium]
MSFSIKVWWKWIAVAVICVVLAIVYHKYNPSDFKLFPKCPFYVLTGLKCPGCGTQRAIHCLLHLEILPAIRYNAFMVFSIPFIILSVISSQIQEKHPALYNRLNKPCVPFTCLVLAIGWWIIRNILDF